MKEKYSKSPHYFIVHLYERWTTAVDPPHKFGRPYVIVCDTLAVNVYGFKDKTEADTYDPLRLRARMTGLHECWKLIPADTEEEARQKIADLPEVKSGAFFLNEKYKYGALENFPTCERMHCDSKENQYCGKPQNDMYDGSIGGCIIDGYDQDDDVLEKYGCPLLKYYAERRKKALIV